MDGTEPPAANSIHASLEEYALETLSLWLILNVSILETTASGISIWWLCCCKDWKPHTTCTLNLAVAELLVSVFKMLLPALHEAIPTAFPSPYWTEVTEASNLGNNSSAILMLAISVERSLALVFKKTFSHFQTKHYCVLCVLLWVLAFLQTQMEYLCLEDTETENVTGEQLAEDVTGEEPMRDYEMQCQKLHSFTSALELVGLTAVMVMCALETFRNFQQERHRRCAKLYAAAMITGLLALGTVPWVQGYTDEITSEIISVIFLLFECYRHKEWKLKQHFKKLWQKLCHHAPEVKQQADDETASAAV